MRRDGDIAIDHVMSATSRVVLCAPFIKASVLSKVFSKIRPGVHVDVVTRWIPVEVAARVSDLEVFDIVQARSATTLRLIDNLHAKIFIADDRVLTGSANITANAFGWCSSPNLEVLVPAMLDDPSIQNCLVAISQARFATEEERNNIQERASAISIHNLPESTEPEAGEPKLWLPRLGAPVRLYAAYCSGTRERLTRDNLEAADYDLAGLGLTGDLDEAAFKTAVQRVLVSMPAMNRILAEADRDLDDARGVALVGAMDPDSPIGPTAQWAIVREWLLYFLADRYEIAPQSFIVRPKTSSSRQ